MVFRILHGQTGGVVRLMVFGEIDLAVHDQLRDGILGAVGTPGITAVVVDLGAVPMLDSGGIGILVAGRTAAQKHRIGYEVCRARWHIRNVLDAVGVLDVLTDAS
ncbi:STAS domain-containing protein [Longispora sp. NPDC051575]|uniref:STAS domain-containing protein n=1 Tax=Longispora sp. NPDC051575 TaxID=3154943 RepID=UPI003420E08F